MVVIETNVYAWVCGIKFALFFVRGMFASDRKKDAWISQRTWKWLRNTKKLWCYQIDLTSELAAWGAWYWNESEERATVWPAQW